MRNKANSKDGLTCVRAAGGKRGQEEFEKLAKEVAPETASDIRILAKENDLDTLIAFAIYAGAVAEKLDLIDGGISSIKVFAESLMNGIAAPGTPVASIYMGDDGHLHTGINPDIGMILANNDVSGNINGQFFFGVEALLHAAAGLAAGRIDQGADLPDTVDHVISTLITALESEIDGLDIRLSSVPDEHKDAPDMTERPSGGSGTLLS